MSRNRGRFSKLPNDVSTPESNKIPIPRTQQPRDSDAATVATVPVDFDADSRESKRPVAPFRVPVIAAPKYMGGGYTMDELKVHIEALNKAEDDLRAAHDAPDSRLNNDEFMVFSDKIRKALKYYKEYLKHTEDALLKRAERRLAGEDVSYNETLRMGSSQSTHGKVEGPVDINNPDGSPVTEHPATGPVGKSKQTNPGTGPGRSPSLGDRESLMDKPGIEQTPDRRGLLALQKQRIGSESKLEFMEIEGEPMGIEGKPFELGEVEEYAESSDSESPSPIVPRNAKRSQQQLEQSEQPPEQQPGPPLNKVVVLDSRPDGGPITDGTRSDEQGIGDKRKAGGMAPGETVRRVAATADGKATIVSEMSAENADKYQVAVRHSDAYSAILDEPEIPQERSSSPAPGNNPQKTVVTPGKPRTKQKLDLGRSVGGPVNVPDKAVFDPVTGQRVGVQRRDNLQANAVADQVAGENKEKITTDNQTSPLKGKSKRNAGDPKKADNPRGSGNADSQETESDNERDSAGPSKKKPEPAGKPDGKSPRKPKVAKKPKRTPEKVAKPPDSGNAGSQETTSDGEPAAAPVGKPAAAPVIVNVQPVAPLQSADNPAKPAEKSVVPPPQLADVPMNVADTRPLDPAKPADKPVVPPPKPVVPPPQPVDNPAKPAEKPVVPPPKPVVPPPPLADVPMNVAETRPLNPTKPAEKSVVPPPPLADVPMNVAETRPLNPAKPVDKPAAKPISSSSASSVDNIDNTASCLQFAAEAVDAVTNLFRSGKALSVDRFNNLNGVRAIGLLIAEITATMAAQRVGIYDNLKALQAPQRDGSARPPDPLFQRLHFAHGYAIIDHALSLSSEQRKAFGSGFWQTATDVVRATRDPIRAAGAESGALTVATFVKALDEMTVVQLQLPVQATGDVKDYCVDPCFGCHDLALCAIFGAIMGLGDQSEARLEQQKALLGLIQRVYPLEHAYLQADEEKRGNVVRRRGVISTVVSPSVRVAHVLGALVHIASGTKNDKSHRLRLIVEKIIEAMQSYIYTDVSREKFFTPFVETVTREGGKYRSYDIRDHARGKYVYRGCVQRFKVVSVPEDDSIISDDRVEDGRSMIACVIWKNDNLAVRLKKFDRTTSDLPPDYTTDKFDEWLMIGSISVGTGSQQDDPINPEQPQNISYGILGGGCFYLFVCFEPSYRMRDVY